MKPGVEAIVFIVSIPRTERMPGHRYVVPRGGGSAGDVSTRVYTRCAMTKQPRSRLREIFIQKWINNFDFFLMASGFKTFWNQNVLNHWPLIKKKLAREDKRRTQNGGGMRRAEQNSMRGGSGRRISIQSCRAPVRCTKMKHHSLAKQSRSFLSSVPDFISSAVINRNVIYRRKVKEGRWMGSGMGWLGGSTIFFLEACNNYHGLGGGWLSRVGEGMAE